jgi:hypothetical protein
MVGDKRKFTLHLAGPFYLSSSSVRYPPMMSGEGFLRAAWHALRETRPVEWLMIILFWYAAAFQKPQNGWTRGPLTTLGLSERE